MRHILIAFCLVFISMPCIAATDSEAGISGAAFLKIGIGARPTALGGAYASIANDSYGAFWNPAGLTGVKEKELTVTRIEWFQDINQNYIGYAQNAGKSGAFGLSVNQLMIDNMIKRDVNGVNLGRFNASDLALTASYAYKTASNMQLGINAKYLKQEIDVESTKGMAFDLGMIYKSIEAPFSFALVVQNLGKGIKFRTQSDPLPTNIKSGFSYTYDETGLTIAMDVNFPNDNKTYGNVGIEYPVTPEFSVRAGYQRFFGGDAGEAKGDTWGFGYRTEKLDVGYSFVSYGTLGNTHTITLTGFFD